MVGPPLALASTPMAVRLAQDLELVSQVRRPLLQSSPEHIQRLARGEPSRVLEGTPTSEDDDETQGTGADWRDRDLGLSRLGCSFDDA